MAKLNACSSSIQLAPSGNGLPSTCSQVGRLVGGAAAVLAALAGLSVLAIPSGLELFTVPLFLSIQLRASLSMRQRYNSAKLRQRTQQLACAVPQDLHSD